MIQVVSRTKVYSWFYVMLLFNGGTTALVTRNYNTKNPTLVSSCIHRNSILTTHASKLPYDDNTAKQIDRAKQLLEEAKKKLALNPPSSSVHPPKITSNTISSSSTSSSRKDQVIKTRNQETGLFTTDGELMAALSAQEEWENKALMDVFESEIEEESEVSKHIAKRDVASSIRNLRKSLQNEDYDKIFDRKNFFIGED